MNCFMYAVDPRAEAHADMRRLLLAAKSGKIKIMVSRHTLDELSKKPDEACELAKTFETVPYWSIGTIREQVATIEQLTGTWEDARRNEDMRLELAQLAKRNASIRDLGAYLDAHHAGADFFVTSDKDLVGSGPAGKIQARFKLRVLTPRQFVSETPL